MAVITTLEHCSLWDRPPNVAGAVLFARFADVIGDVRWTERLDNGDECQLSVPFTSPGTVARPQMVLTLHFAPDVIGGAGALRYFRVVAVTQDASPSGILYTLEGRSLALDLTSAGRVRDVLAGGRQEFAVAGTLAGNAWVSTYVQPQLARAGFGFYTGVSVPSAPAVPLAFEHWTGTEVLQAIADYLGMEWEPQPVGGAWQLHMTSQINSFLEPLRVTDGVSLRRLLRRRDMLEQATVVEPVGRAGHSTLAQSVQHFAVGGGSVNTASNTLVTTSLADDSGYSSLLVQFDGQWVGYYLQRVATGRCFQIVDSEAATQVVTCDDLSNRVTYADDLTFELRASRTSTPTLFVPTPGIPLRVTSASGQNPVTVDDPWAASDPSTVFNQHFDCHLLASSLALATTCSNIATVSTTEQDLTVASTAGLSAGFSWGVLHNNVAVPWGLYGRPFDVVQIISPTVVRVRMRYPFETGLPLTAGAVAKQARFFNPRNTVQYVEAEAPASNQLTLSTASSIFTDDIVEYHLDSGALVAGIPAPSAAPIGAGGYGVISKTAELEARCLRNLLHAGNPWFDTWTGGAGSLPDGYTKVGAATVTKVTTGLPGPGTTHAVLLNGSSTSSIVSPVFFVRPSAGDSKVSVRARLRTPGAANWDPANNQEIQLRVRLPGGTILGTASIVPPGYAGPTSAAREVEASTVVDVELLAVEVLHTAALGTQWAPWDGLQVVVTSVQGSGAANGPSFTLGGIFVVQDSLLPASPDMVKVSDQALFGLSQLRLDRIDQPIDTIDADAIDLSRLLTEQFGVADLRKGRRVQIAYEPLGLVVEDRIDALEFRASLDGETRVTVQTRRRDLASTLARQLSPSTASVA